MRDLPKYAFLTNPSEFSGVQVIMLEFPYLIASIYEVKQTEAERLEDFMSAKAQERYPIAKVKGYSVFLKMFTSLEPCDNPGFQQAILDEMAEFVLTERIERKLGQFKGCCESERTIRQLDRAKEHAMKLRSRKNRPNE